MHQLITGLTHQSQPSATHIGYGVRCRVTSGYDWSDICQPWGKGERPVLLQCLAVSACRCFQQSNVSQNVVYSQNNMLLTAKLVIFLCSVISQGKVVSLDRWGGKWNHLLMTHRLTTNYAENYCNRTLIVKVIVENVITCFFLGHSVVKFCKVFLCIFWPRIVVIQLIVLQSIVIADCNLSGLWSFCQIKNLISFDFINY